MVLLSGLRTVFCDACFRDSSPTQLTTQKSVCYLMHISTNPSNACFSTCRVLLASIKFLGNCPCPRCFIQKDQISALGTTVDRQRWNHMQEDNLVRQNMITTVCRWIFERGRSLTGPVLGRVLKRTSSVPTVVCPSIRFPRCSPSPPIRTHSRRRF
jgi:hypothetical protein